MRINDLLAWAFAAVFAVLGGWVIAFNVGVFYRHFARRPHGSWIPLVGGFLGFLAMLACPLPAVRQLAWLPLFLDPGSVFGLLYTIVFLIYTLFAAPDRADQTTRPDEPR